MFLIRNTNNITKFVRYSHERSSLLDILHQKKQNVNLLNNKNNILYQHKIVINLFGQKKIVDYASLEIQLFSQERVKHISNVVYYPELLKKLTLKTSINQVIINRCYDMIYNDTLLLNSIIIGNWKPYNLYISANCSNINLISKQFNDIYNIRSEKEIKKQQIKKIFDYQY